MSTEIYYFTGSGNSLAVARTIAEKINGKLISIPSVMGQESIKSQAGVIGFVFPVYYATFGESGIPMIVERFIRKLKNLGSRYIFAICTHGGAPVKTIESFREMIHSQGGNLSAGFAVKMGNPYSAMEKIEHVLFQKELEIDCKRENEKRRKISNDWEEKLKDICEYIDARKKGKFETQGKVIKRILSPYYAFQKGAALHRYRELSLTTKQTLEELIPLADSSFYSDQKCSGCGTCVKVCPVNNIVLANNKPVWKHNCETCFACFQWCPKEAIHGDIVEYEKRYHLPGVKLKDMLKRNDPPELTSTCME